MVKNYSGSWFLVAPWGDVEYRSIAADRTAVGVADPPLEDSGRNLVSGLTPLADRGATTGGWRLPVPAVRTRRIAERSGGSIARIRQ
jgi:hypothetical protein